MTRHYGQGMVRPGAWSVGGVMQRTDVDDLHCPVPEMWSKSLTETREMSMRLARSMATQGLYYSTTTGVVMHPASSTGVEMPMAWGTHGAFWAAYARSPIGIAPIWPPDALPMYEPGADYSA